MSMFIADALKIWLVSIRTGKAPHAERTLNLYTSTLNDNGIASADLIVDSRLRLPNL